MANKLPSIPEPGNNMQSLLLTVRTMMQFLNQITQNHTGVPAHQYFERANSSTTDTLRKEVALLRAEFEKYKRDHP